MEETTSSVETIVLDQISSIEGLVNAGIVAILAITVAMVGLKYGKRLMGKA